MKINQIIKSEIKKSKGYINKACVEKIKILINDSLTFPPWNYWLGTKIQKNPLDLMVLQDIFFEKRPNTIIECGTYYGGSAHYMASLMDLLKIDGKVITIDMEELPEI